MKSPTLPIKILLTLSFVLIFSCNFVDSSSSLSLGYCCKFQGQFSNGKCVTSSSLQDREDSFGKIIEIPKYILHKSSLSEEFPLVFSLIHRPISCTNGSFTIRIPTGSTNASESKDTVEFYGENGMMRFKDDYFYLEDYCVDRYTEDVIDLEVCFPDCSLGACIPKCCGLDEVWDISKYPDGPLKCSPVTGSDSDSSNIDFLTTTIGYEDYHPNERRWVPQIYAAVDSKNDLVASGSLRPHIKKSHPRDWCRAEASLHALKSMPEKDIKRKKFKILQDGKVWMKLNRRQWAPIPDGQFCIDGAKGFETMEQSTDNPSNVSDPYSYSEYSGNYLDTIVVDCSTEDESDCQSREPSDLYGISLIIGSAFLLITVIVYVLLWEKQNVKGWTSLAYFLSLFFMYLFTAAVHFGFMIFTSGGSGASWICYLIGVGTHFSWLASFCWMSALNFDLWWTFRALMPTGSKSKGIKRFLAYALFAWGVPLVIVSVAVTLDNVYSDDLESDVITPDYGKKTCSMSEQFAPFPYLYGPVAFLLSCNLVFFTITVYDMYKIQQSTKFASASSSKNSNQKQSMLLFAKLFLLMGIPWGFEVISWAISPCGQVAWYWTIFDMLNIFQSVAIFITFACKSETRTSLENKFPAFKRFMLKCTFRPDKAKAILSRYPKLRFIVRPLTRSKMNPRAFSTSGKTLSSTVTLSDVSSSRSTVSIKGNPV